MLYVLLTLYVIAAIITIMQRYIDDKDGINIFNKTNFNYCDSKSSLLLILVNGVNY